LLPGGHFFFDVNNRLAIEKIPMNTHAFNWGRAAVVFRMGYNRRRNKGWLKADWSIRAGRQWRLRGETFEEVWWTRNEIRRGLRDAGFESVFSWDAAPFFEDHPLIYPG